MSSRQVILRSFALLAFFAVSMAFVLLPGCSKAERHLSTGKVILAKDLPGWTPDTAYAEVNPECLPDLYANFRDVLSRQGLVKWDKKYDCNHFAALYVALAQARYTVAAWHSETDAQTLALAEVWYRTGPDSGHAIVEAYTSEGIIFIEPQTGQRIAGPSPDKVILRKW